MKNNQKVNIFQVQQNRAGEEELPKTSEVVGSSVFKFLHKNQNYEWSSKLARGYLIVDKKGKIIPVHNYDLSAEKYGYIVVALWISGPSVKEPTDISKGLMHKIRQRLTEVSSKNSYICKCWISSYWIMMNSRVLKLKMSDIIPKNKNEAQTLDPEDQEKLWSNDQNGNSIDWKPKQPLYIFTLSGKHNTNICSCWKSFNRKENDLEKKSRKRSSRRSSKSKKDRASSK